MYLSNIREDFIIPRSLCQFVVVKVSHRLSFFLPVFFCFSQLYSDFGRKLIPSGRKISSKRHYPFLKRPWTKGATSNFSPGCCKICSVIERDDLPNTSENKSSSLRLDTARQFGARFFSPVIIQVSSYRYLSQFYFTINLEKIFYFNNKKCHIYAAFGVSQTPIYLIFERSRCTWNLAEKPSVAQSIAKVLGAAKREDGYLVVDFWHYNQKNWKDIYLYYIKMCRYT